MHIFNVSITTMQGLKNVSLKAREELITQSTYPIKDARPPARHSPFYKPDALCATRPMNVIDAALGALYNVQNECNRCCLKHYIMYKMNVIYAIWGII
jgi:hypothetical protein